MVPGAQVPGHAPSTPRRVRTRSTSMCRSNISSPAISASLCRSFTSDDLILRCQSTGFHEARHQRRQLGVWSTRASRYNGRMRTAAAADNYTYAETNYANPHALLDGARSRERAVGPPIRCLAGMSRLGNVSRRITNGRFFGQL
jgi:hypothetical protein